MADRAFVLCDSAGRALPGSHRGRGRRIIDALNRPVEAKLTLSVEDEATEHFLAALRNGIPQLRVYEDGELTFSGHWWPQDGGGTTAEQSYLNLTFKDAYAELERRFVRADVTFNSTDAGQILSSLIATTNDLSDTTLRIGSIATTVARDRTYEAGKQIAEAGIQLTEVIGGFDFRVDPLDPTEEDGDTGELVILAGRGALREAAKFEFGPETLANLRGYNFTTQRPSNRVLAIGGGEPAIRSEVALEGSEAIFRSQQQSTADLDVTEQATLNAKAGDALRANPLWAVQIQPDPALAPVAGTDFDVGDTVPVNIRHGKLEIAHLARVTRIERGIGDSDEIEDYVVGFDTEGEVV